MGQQIFAATLCAATRDVVVTKQCTLCQEMYLFILVRCIKDEMRRQWFTEDHTVIQDKL